MKRISLLPLICSLLLGCTDEGEPVAPDALTSSNSLVRILPGVLQVVQISGGTPPYEIVRHPAPSVTVSFEDSTASPANLLIRGSGGIGDTTTMVVGDSDPVNQSIISITIQLVTDGISYTDHIQTIWDIYCRNKGCHPGGGAPFSLDASVSYTNLYNAAVSNMTCGPEYRVEPYNPDSSLVYLLVSGKTSCPRMPFAQPSGDTLILSDQLAIWVWIAEGAQNN